MEYGGDFDLHQVHRAGRAVRRHLNKGHRGRGGTGRSGRPAGRDGRANRQTGRAGERGPRSTCVRNRPYGNKSRGGEREGQSRSPCTWSATAGLPNGLLRTWAVRGQDAATDRLSTERVRLADIGTRGVGDVWETSRGERRGGASARREHPTRNRRARAAAGPDSPRCAGTRGEQNRHGTCPHGEVGEARIG